MAAKSYIPTLPAVGTRRWLWWLLAGFGGIVVIMVVVYYSKKSVRRPGASNNPAGNPTNADGTPGPVLPDLPPMTTPPYVPPVIPTPTPAPNDGVDPLSVNWDYVKGIAWKTRASIYEGQDYRCEVTNGIIEMGEQDLKALNLIYKQYYNGSLQMDYCNNWKDSGCFGSWFESKEQTACERLKNIL